ncbi:retrovirus-related pol polyprotein from transposon TNT 1-94 [Tanacetum coccineum]|uniref:Retrovirus-related pol polyprotein from transposon TNT 1-94 n=1 Tax=Tanacetum coccineum TaxID=301880 RepID=A0ABQ5C4R9_9ASTR
MLAEAQEAGQILDEEQLEFIADPRIAEIQVDQQIIPQNSAFLTEYLDAYDSDCDDISSAKVVLMANLSSCDPDVLSEVPYSDSYPNDMINQDSQDTGIQDTNSSTPNDLLVLSLVEQMTDHVANLDKENQTNKMINESLTAELERYKERVTIFKQRLNVDLNKQHAVISVIDDEETLILEELNKINEDFGKHFFTKKELSAEQAFWLKYLNYNPNISVKSHTTVRIKAPSELPKVSLVIDSLKKLKYQLASFDKVVKKRTTSDAITAAQINAKSVENSDLNAQLQEKVFAIAALKNELRKLKGKNVVNIAVSKSSATIAPGIFKLDIEPISHRLKNNRDSHEIYLEKTIENTDTLHGLVECPRKYLTKHCEKLVAVTPMNKEKNLGVKPTTSSSGSKPSGNTKYNKITRPPSSNQKNKVEEHPRKVKPNLNKMNSISEPISNAHVKHYVRNAKVESICAICNKCLFNANHDTCVIDYVNDTNVRSKSKSKRNKMRKVWKPTGNVFNEMDIVGNLQDEVPEFVIKFLKMIQVHLNITVRNIKTDNGIEFVNQTLKAYYKEVGILHQTSVARTSQQNGVVKRQNRLMPNIPSSTLYVLPIKNGWEILFQPMFDEYHNPPPCVDLQVPTVIAIKPAVSTGIPSSTTIDQDAPSTNNVHSINQPPEHINKWTKDHSIDNVIGDPSRPISTRHQLQDEALFCYFDAFLSPVEPRSYKEALKESY